MKRAFLSLALLLGLSGTAHASAWYVRGTASCANNGDGTASGCAASAGAVGAWKDFSNITWASINGGDTLYLAWAADESYTSTLTLGKSGVSAVSRITVTVGNAHTATIDLSDVGGSVGIRINDRTFVTVDGGTCSPVSGNLNCGIKIRGVGSSGSVKSYGVYEFSNAAALDVQIMRLDICSNSQLEPDDNGGGIYVTNALVSASGVWEIAYNYIHSCIAPVNITSITESGTTATVTTSSPHGFPGSGTYTVGIHHPAVNGYDQRSSDSAWIPGRWVATTVDATHFTYSQTTINDPNTGLPETLPSGLANAGATGFVIYNWYATGMTFFTSKGQTTYTNTLVHDNLVQDVYNDGIRCGANCSLYNNIVKHVDGSGHSDSLLIQSAGYGQIYNNYVEDSVDQNIYLDNLYDSTCAHIRVYNNVINSNPGIGMNMDPEGAAGAGTAASTCSGASSTWDDIEVMNNTFYSTSASEIRKGRNNPVTNMVILNNVFGAGPTGGYTNLDLHNSVSATLASSTSWDYDVFSESSGTALSNFGGANKTLAQLQALSPARETNGSLGSPAYVDAANADFHLSSSDTVAKGKAANLYATYAFLQADKDGNARPASGAWDAGAYQYAAGGAPPPGPVRGGGKFSGSGRVRP